MKHTLRIACIVVLIGAQQVLGQTPTLPRLQHVFTSTTVELSPLNRVTPIAVGPQGNLLFVSSATASELQMSLVDSRGKLITRFGRTGSGPGEVRTPKPIEITKDRMIVWDDGNNALTEWDLRGTFLQTLRPSEQTQPKILGKELLGMKLVAGIWKPITIARPGGLVRELLPATDTFATAHFGLVNGKSKSRFAPIPGLWEDGFVVADAANYAMALYHWDGVLVRELHRELPPAHASGGRFDEFVEQNNRQARARGGPVLGEPRLTELRKMALDEVLPQITPGAPIRTDSHNRIWVLGMESDSAYADIFTRDRFVGRLHLPCRLYNGYWSLSATWFAIACLPDDKNFDGDAVVKLFRIVEGR